MRMGRVIALCVVFEILESCEPLFEDLGVLFAGFETWEGFVACIGRGSLFWIFKQKGL